MNILIISDSGVPSGYGRIADEIGISLFKRGHEVMALSWKYDGLLPATYNGRNLPYHVGVLSGKPDPLGEIAKVIGVLRPDIVLSVQDFPFHTQLFYHPAIDWSQVGRVLITPVDGTPIFPAWLDLLNVIDGALTISQFGVNAFREAGYTVGLCRPGINADQFVRLPDAERADIRAKLGIADGAFVLGTMAQNQGRKAISLMLRGFFEFAKDKPTARYLLDMEETSQAGWDIVALCQQQGWDTSKIIFRRDAVQLGVVDLTQRYNALDAHVVLSHREGYGLPLPEAMACGVVSMAMDYCSGREVVGDGKGCLIKCIEHNGTDYTVPGAWGGAEDKFPDLADFVRQLQWLHDNPAEREAMAKRGMEWSRRQSWDMAADNVIATLERVMETRAAWKQAQPAAPVVAPELVAPPCVSPDGQNAADVELVEAAA